MSADCSHRHNVKVAESPAAIEGHQQAYRTEIARRLRNLRGALRETIVENDALRIAQAARNNAERGGIEDREDFGFEQDTGKQIAFREQVREWIDEGVLEQADPQEVEDGQHWTSIYVSAAYAEGINLADGLLVDNGVSVPDTEVGDVLSTPIHAETLETIYSRNYSNLEDITDDIDQTISNTFVTALREGWGARKTGDAITREVREIQRTRARALARTEMMNAHNKSALKRYGEFDVSEVEILTHNPCPVCQGIEAGDPYTLMEARGLIPAHPNCVCTYAPIV